MSYLLIAICLTISLYLLFKLFKQWGVDSFQAIVVNYFTAGTLAYAFIAPEDNTLITQQSWFIPTLILGAFFILIFNLMAITTQKLGMAVSSLASKLSLIIPTAAAIYLQGDQATSQLVIGVLLALVAVYLTLQKEGELKASISLAILLFIGNGLLDSLLSQIQHDHLSTDLDFQQFSFTVFAAAFSIGMLLQLFRKVSWNKKSVAAGVLLGIPNYFSIYFLLFALDHIDSSQFYPLFNISIVLFSALIGWKFFKEDLSRTNWIGIFLACISILIIMFA